MTAFLRGWWDTFLRWLRPVTPPPPQGQPLMRCLHLAWGPCHWRYKGTTPGYKGSGWYAQCLNCGTWAPC